MNFLENLALRYIQSTGGDYEKIEPQVYDIVLPDSIAQQLQLPASKEIYRITFDSEALTDHPHAQLLAFGHPALDQIFALAHQQGVAGKVFLSGFNLHPHQLLQKIKQQIHIHKDLRAEFETERVLHFTHWFFWFQATFICDEKTQHVFEIGVDQYYGRLTRHLQELLDAVQITSVPVIPYPDAGGTNLIDAYLLARSEALLKLRPTMRRYKEKLEAHQARESNQITKYFNSMVFEIEERQKKLLAADQDHVGFQQQKKSLEVEKNTRLMEIQKKMTLKVDLKLMNLLSVIMPKIVIPLKLTSKRNITVSLTLLWNPLSQSIEPVSCPQCLSPTLQIVLGSQGLIGCPKCQ